MIRSAASKVMWVGRATVFLVGLAVILALVFGVVSTALGKNGNPFILGKGNNVATKVTGLIGKVASGSALVVKNPSGGGALDLSVGDPAADPATKTVAPMKVDSQRVVTNLNADKLDGEDSAAYQRRVSGQCAAGRSIQTIGADGAVTCETDDDGTSQVDALKRELGTNDARTNEASDPVSFAKVKDVPQEVLSRDADRFDGLDSAAFGIATEHARTSASACDNSITNECAKILVEVPPGKQYVVSVWSTMSIRGGTTEHDVLYCSAQNKQCITPSKNIGRVTLPAGGKTVTASSMGETPPLPEGTYTFSTVIQTGAQFSQTTGATDDIVTKVMVRDASAPLPTGVSSMP